METQKISSLVNASNTSASVIRQSDLINEYQMHLIFVVNFSGICCIVCFLGIIANIINMTVFTKQGFKNAVNISFFGLAISDLCCVATLFWQCICLNPLVITSGIVWVPLDFVYLTGAWPHNISGRITSYITIYVTLERYLCITVPLKVKEIFSPGRTTLAVVLIFLVNISTLVPEYATCYLGWNFFRDSNKTLLSLSFTSGHKNVEGLVYIINSASGVVSFVGITVITCVLVVKLKETSQWRQEATSGSNNQGAMSTRDKKMLKMITVIACILIVCYTPGIIVSMVAFIEPQFNHGSTYSNTFSSMWSICGVFQALNSSINVVLYYRMSSKYRETFQKLFITCSCNENFLSRCESFRKLRS